MNGKKNIGKGFLTMGFFMSYGVIAMTISVIWLGIVFLKMRSLTQ